MHYTFIVNPIAGGGRARRNLSRILRDLQDGAVDHSFQVTEGRGHATELAFRAAEHSDVVVAVGGDGTVHEVAHGLLLRPGKAALGIIPAGTGNDIIKNLDIPAGVGAALQVVLTGRRRSIDVGRIDWTGLEDQGWTTFVNATGIGLDARVADAVSGRKGPLGPLAYFAVLPKLIREWNAPRARVERSRDEPPLFDEKLLLMTAGNGLCSGGAFYLTPDAIVDDGLLDVCVIRDLPVGRILTLLPQALRGRHTTAPEVLMLRLPSLVLRSETPVTVHVDGEIATRAATEVEVSTLPGRLEVVVPRGDYEK